MFIKTTLKVSKKKLKELEIYIKIQSKSEFLDITKVIDFR